MDTHSFDENKNLLLGPVWVNALLSQLGTVHPTDTVWPSLLPVKTAPP